MRNLKCDRNLFTLKLLFSPSPSFRIFFLNKIVYLFLGIFSLFSVNFMWGEGGSVCVQYLYHRLDNNWVCYAYLWASVNYKYYGDFNILYSKYSNAIIRWTESYIWEKENRSPYLHIRKKNDFKEVEVI